MQNQSPVFFFAGLAQNQLPEVYLRQHFLWQGSQHFPDHYPYRPQDVEKMVQWVKKKAASGTSFITTEKDYAKLQQAPLRECFEELPLYVLPIRVQFLEKEADFKALVGQCLASLEK
ncbi:MAG: tetraacyldisaccharide 4'-kinase [Microscillaceae bacterium]|nr:tetraacyldisaccharide 4'-kinase [Microscillaceae bacterium]